MGDELPVSDRPISEQYRIVAKEWVDAEAAAHLLEETKSVVLEQRKNALIASTNISDAAAERLVKASDEWHEHVKVICRARAKANLLRVKLKYVEMRHREWVGANADARAELRLAGGDP